MGKLLHLFKYKNDYSKLDPIIMLAKPFIESWKTTKVIDIVLPIPPSTLKECVRVLREDSKIKKIFVLTITKTRKG